jgi:nucleoside-diphosphate-sugar epimerase
MSPAGDAYQGSRALVLGASGFIGRWIVRTLTQAGAEVIAGVRDPETAAGILGRWGAHGGIVTVDLARAGAVGSLIRTIEPAIVFNAAGYGVDRNERDHELLRRLNHDLVAEIASGLRDRPRGRWAGARLVHCGSALEYGTLDGDLAEEGPAPQPTDPYGQSKLAGTVALRRIAVEAGMPSVTARLFTVYGPGEHPTRLLPTLLMAAATGAPVPLTTGAQMRDFTFVEDVAEGLLRLGAAVGTPGEVVNLATGKLLSVRDFARQAAHVLLIPEARLQFGLAGTHIAEMQHKPVTVAKLQHLTGWYPSVSVENGVRRTIAFQGGP